MWKIWRACVKKLLLTQLIFDKIQARRSKQMSITIENSKHNKSLKSYALLVAG